MSNLRSGLKAASKRSQSGDGHNITHLTVAGPSQVVGQEKGYSSHKSNLKTPVRLVHLEDKRQLFERGKQTCGRIQELKISGSEIAQLRTQYGMKKAQFASALHITTTTLDRWEKSDITPVTRTDVKSDIQTYQCTDKNTAFGKNLCFSQFPLSFAREALQLSVLEIATRYGYSEGAWRKFECHERSLSRDIIVEIEKSIRDVFVRTVFLSDRVSGER